jgi:hypothetical protein
MTMQHREDFASQRWNKFAKSFLLGRCELLPGFLYIVIINIKWCMKTKRLLASPFLLRCQKRY